MGKRGSYFSAHGVFFQILLRTGFHLTRIENQIRKGSNQRKTDLIFNHFFRLTELSQICFAPIKTLNRNGLTSNCFFILFILSKQNKPFCEKIRKIFFTLLESFVSWVPEHLGCPQILRSMMLNDDFM